MELQVSGRGDQKPKLGGRRNWLIERNPISLHQWQATWPYLSRLWFWSSRFFFLFLDEGGQTIDGGQWKCSWLRWSLTQGCPSVVTPLWTLPHQVGWELLLSLKQRGKWKDWGCLQGGTQPVRDRFVGGAFLVLQWHTPLSLSSHSLRSPGFCCQLPLWLKSPDGVSRSSLLSILPWYLYAPN